MSESLSAILDRMWTRGKLAESATLPGKHHQWLVELAMEAEKLYATHAGDCMCDLCFVARSMEQELSEDTTGGDCPPDCKGPCVIGCEGDAYANRSQFEGL